LIVFHTSGKNGKTVIYFPHSQISVFSFHTSRLYETLNQQICNIERQKLVIHYHFVDLFYQNIIDCFLNNADIMALWVSYNPTFTVFSLVFNNNDQEGYISKDIE
jgi:hypothetical protein